MVVANLVLPRTLLAIIIFDHTCIWGVKIMVISKVSVKLPNEDYLNSQGKTLTEKCADLTDYYLTQESWPSHQSVFKGVAELYQLEFPPEALRLLSGFTAGAGFTGEICGALSGGIAVLGYIYGNDQPMDRETYQTFVNTIMSEETSPREKAKRVLDAFSQETIFNRLVVKFKEKYGNVRRADIIAPYQADPISRKRFGRCRRVVSGTAALTAQIIWEVETTQQPPAMGYNIYSHFF